jgi:16S rRNA (uracil1498-N3)-methyltransferase
MNILLFQSEQAAASLQPDSPKAVHVREVLKMGVGDELFVGIINGPRGKATITQDDDQAMTFEIAWEKEIPALHPLTLIVGLSRPQTCRKILHECTSLGVQKIAFFQAEKGHASYANSKLWNTDEWQQLLILGAEQAFNTRLPEIEHFDSLEKCLKEIGPHSSKVALDLYEAELQLGDFPISGPTALAIGPERGWSAHERTTLREANYTLAQMNDRVLRTETASVAASAIILSNMNLC